MNLHSTFSSPVAWIAERLVALPGGLRRRALVLTASERLAHAIRREVAVHRGRPECLAGVAFARPVDLARDLLARHGSPRLGGWEVLRQGRILQLLQSGAFAGRLSYFEPSQLRTGQGYAEALAEAILDLEASGLTPAHLDETARSLSDDARAAARLRDLAVVWRTADDGDGDRRTAAQLLAEAAALLAGTATCGRDPGASESLRAVPTLPAGQLSFDELFRKPPQPPPAASAGIDLPPLFAVLVASPSTTLLRFLAAIDGAEVVFQDARPLRTATHRWRALAAVAPAPSGDDAAAGEIGLVRRFLFEIPENLTDPARPRSRGPDGSVDLEEHAGIEDEVEASATWVAEQIAAGTTLERIAIVVPEKGSYAALLVDRLARFGAAPDTGPVGVYVAGGLALAEAPAGRRFGALLSALAGGLAAVATLRILPALRRAGQAPDAPATRLSPSRCAEIIYAAGIAGGGAGDLDGMRQWAVKLRAHRERVAALVAAFEQETDPGHVRRIEAANANRWLRDVEPILPAVEALQAVAEAVAADVPFSALWPQLREFAQRHFLLPADPPGFVAVVDEIVAPALADPFVAALPASLALRWLAQRLQRERRPCGRFGEPRVFIGTPGQAAGLEFDAVRIVGLTEGGLPRTPHDDPIVPDDLRRRIEASAREQVGDVVVPTLADRVLDDLHGVFRVVSGARDRLALSVPRQWVDRSEREVSGIVLEVATALARPGASGGDGDVPTSGRLRSAYFAPGAAARAAAARQWPASERGVLASVAAGDGTLRVPASWLAAGAADLGRVREIAAAAETSLFGAADGVVGDLFRRWQDLGSEARPISSSALHLLLGCPHRFLLERGLHWREPPQRPTTDAIEPITYGTLFHEICETLMREAGPQICRKDGSVEWWARRAREIAGEAFERLVERYPLRGSEARERERQRLFAQVESLVRDEWDRPQRTFVAVEMPFGRDRPVALPAGERVLHVWGAIDRVDALPDGTLSVRDLKTGRVRDLAEEEVNAARDLQIGMYSAVVEAIDPGGRPVGEASYVHPSTAQEPERAFRGAQLHGLRQRAGEWLRVAADLLARGTFVRTPSPEDCRMCPFLPRCGTGAQARSERKLLALPSADPLAAFLAMKRERKFEE